MNYLIQLSLGPVQGFIATARRSRDLWFGSYILSEISKAAAKSLSDAKHILIFPHTEHLTKALAADSELLVSNIVVCELKNVTSEGAKAALTAAVTASEARWVALCEDAKKEMTNLHESKVKPKLSSVGLRLGVNLAAQRYGVEVPDKKPSFYDDSIWTAQLSDVVEIYQGAVPYDGTSITFATANTNLRTLMGQRKNTRYFAPFNDKAFLPKSSMDGAQSNVIAAAGTLAKRRKLGIDPKESLDTAALVKRVLGRSRGFLPVSRVALQPWVDANKDKADLLMEVMGLFDDLSSKEHDLSTKLTGKYADDWIKSLPYDGQLMYRFRIDAAKFAEGEATIYPDTNCLLDLLNSELGDVYKTHGSPQPYYAMILADGDKMGALLDKATDANTMRLISAALSAFAQSVPETMAKHQGACIYSGGDDVLGLLPLHTALAAVDDLRTQFKIALEKLATTLEAEPPTLSVGLVIAHFLEPLGDVRRLAAKAEKLAKGANLDPKLTRNALGIIVKPRSGAAMQVRMRWTEPEVLERIKTWASWMSVYPKPAGVPSLSRGLPDELERAYDQMVKPMLGTAKPIDEVLFATYWNKQVSTILANKQQDDKGLDPSILASLKEALLIDPVPAKSEPPAQPVPAKLEHPYPPIEQLKLARWLAGHSEKGALE